ncbi:MAG: hypothetical protein E6J34_07955 [Chloroflexi bacterium]|nr:MAG: hypothetical protein E6J34_07955 [Chloroflexota bacterium]
MIVSYHFALQCTTYLRHYARKIIAKRLSGRHAHWYKNGKSGTYFRENGQIGKLTVEQSLLRHFYRTGSIERRFIDDAEMLFGYRYRSAAILAKPDTNMAPLTQHPSQLDGEPGTRAPHLMLRRGESLISTIDLRLGNWTLLVGIQDTDWSEAARGVSQETDLLITAHHIEGVNGCKDTQHCFEECFEISSKGAVLVRPDGFVAWRSLGGVNHPHTQLRQAISRLLGREPNPA